METWNLSGDGWWWGWLIDWISDKKVLFDVLLLHSSEWKVVFVHAQWILPRAPVSAAMQNISWSRLTKTFPVVAPGLLWTRPGNIGQRVLSTTSLLTEWCRGWLICVREASYWPVQTRRNGLLRREPTFCFSISKQWVMCILMSGMLSLARQLERAPMHHWLLQHWGSLVHSSQIPDSWVIVPRIPKIGSMKLEITLLPLNSDSSGP